MKRVGGHVLGERGWEIAAPAGEPPAVTAEPEIAESLDVSDYHVGGGWYQIGDEKVHGKDAARAALEGDEMETQGGNTK